MIKEADTTHKATIGVYSRRVRSRSRSAQMTRFTVLEDGDDFGAGPSSPARSPAPKRFKVFLPSSSASSRDEDEIESTVPKREVDEEGEEEEEMDEEEDEMEEEEEGIEEDEEEVEETEDDEEAREESVPENAVLTFKRYTVSESSVGNGSISVILTDPDVLDCPICFDSLTVPVFQCENGHIACSSCCTKIVNKCPSCAWPIGYNRCRAIENVIECVKVSCQNMTYGCMESLIYCKKSDHESACLYTPCSCPLLNCDFIGIPKQVYSHFGYHNMVSARNIVFNSIKQISLETHLKYIFLREKTEGILFILRHHSDHLGSAVNIICIAPSSSKRRFPYSVTARDGESSVNLQSVAENIPDWSEEMPSRIFLLVPNDLMDSSDTLKLEVCIKAS